MRVPGNGADQKLDCIVFIPYRLLHTQGSKLCVIHKLNRFPGNSYNYFSLITMSWDTSVQHGYVPSIIIISSCVFVRLCVRLFV